MKNTLIAAAFALLVACSTTPETGQQRLVYAEAQLTAVTEHAVEMRESGELSDESYAEALELIVKADQSLDVAWTLVDRGDNWQEHLSAAQEALLAVQEMMDE